MLSSRKRYRIGIDLGTSSLGWCALELDPAGSPSSILAIGSRIFGDGRNPKSKASLAVERREARAMRRRRDRFKRRRDALLKHLAQDGLFPADPIERKRLEGLDPFELRARALDEALPVHHIGRALFHLDQRRGFKSNRKTDLGAEDDAGKIAIGVDRLKAAMAAAGARTFGEFLHRRRQVVPNPIAVEKHVAVPSVRTRLRPETGEGAKGDGYDFYPGRDLIEDEFDAILEAQKAHHPDILTSVVRARLHEIVFHQRPLKDPPIGRCTLVAGEERLPKAHPLFQRRRLLEEVNALQIVLPGQEKQPLDRVQRDLVLRILQDKQKVSFATLRKKLKFDPAARFNKESENRSELAGDEIRAQLADKKRFGPRWVSFSTDQQWAVVSRLRDEEDEAALLAWLTSTFDLDADRAKAVASTRLPQGFGRFGLTATTALIEALTADVITYDKAVERAGLGHHSDFRSGQVFTDDKGNPAMPYYGVALERHVMPGTSDPNEPDEALRVGRITNPTVHIGLNQLRRVVNAIIRCFGPPAEIAIELARDLKLSDDEKQERERENLRNRREAEKRSEKLRAIGQADTGANRALLKLWEELEPDNVLDRRCVYSGQQISCAMLFNGMTEVDHILPFSETLDDSQGNKILALREPNRLKRKRTPYEARHDLLARFGPDAEWDAIARRVARLPKGKRWRFEPDAMERFRENEGFLARQLVDTQYLSRLAREYLCTLFPETGEDSSHVWVSPGRLTEIVRRKLGLNELLPDHNYAGVDQEKNRLDHRHHAIDAFVVGIVDRGMLQRIARASAMEGRDGPERVMVPEPWDGFREELRVALNRTVVSHRPDHGTVSKRNLARGKDQTAGRLHNDTAYGLTGETDAKGNDLVVRRVPLTSLKPSHLEGEHGVRDPDLKAALRDFTRGRDGKDFELALREFVRRGPLQFRGIRRLRVVEPLAVIPVRDSTGRAYKGYKGDSNYRYDVWEMPDGTWRAEVVSMFDAHQPGWTSVVRAGCPAARKVLSLQRDDTVAVEQDASRRLMRVVKFGQNGQITLAEPQEAGDLKRRDALSNEVDPFKYMAPTASGLKKLRTRQIRIDELGRVRDPGFPARKTRRPTRKPIS